jgi:hypothetical protein
MRTYNHEPWKGFSIGFHKSLMTRNSKENLFSSVINHNAIIEESSHNIIRLIHENRLADGIREIKESPIISPYFNQILLNDEKIIQKLTIREFNALRVIAFLRLLISQVALLETVIHSKSNDYPSFSLLLEKDNVIMPGRKLIKLIYTLLSIKNHHEFLVWLSEKVSTYEEPINETTLKRWFSGEEFPSVSKIKIICASINSDYIKSVVSNFYWAANRFRFFGEHLGWLHNTVFNFKKNELEEIIINEYKLNPINNIGVEYSNWMRYWQTTPPNFQKLHENFGELSAYLQFP